MFIANYHSTRSTNVVDVAVCDDSILPLQTLIHWKTSECIRIVMYYIYFYHLVCTGCLLYQSLAHFRDIKHRKWPILFKRAVHLWDKSAITFIVWDRELQYTVLLILRTNYSDLATYLIKAARSKSEETSDRVSNFETKICMPSK